MINPNSDLLIDSEATDSRSGQNRIYAAVT